MFTAFGRRGLAGLVLAGITALVRGGAGTSTGNAAFAAITRPHAPGSMRGRVFSAFGLIWPSTRLASLLLGGLLAGTAGIRAACHLGGALLAAAALDGLILR